jgi:signal peptide peptidase SppA
MERRKMLETEPFVFHIPLGEALAIRPEYLEWLAQYDGHQLSDIRAAISRDRSVSGAAFASSDTAIIPIIGAISRYDTICSRVFGGVSVEEISANLAAAMASSSVKSILLEVDSPGGQVAGIADLADEIKAASQLKPVVAFVSDTSASAAYWLTAASSKIVLSQSAFVGSIGVVASFIDSSKADSARGVSRIEIVSSNAPRKRPDLSSDDGLSQIREQVDALESIFIKTIANFRGTTIENVVSNFGQGDIVIAPDAVRRGMADSVGAISDAADLAGELASEMAPKFLLSFADKTALVTNKTIMPGGEKMDEETISVSQAKELEQKGRADGATEGAKAERARIKAIYDLVRGEHMAIAGDAIKSALFDGKSTAGDVASLILAAENAKREAMKAARAQDAAAIPPIASAETAPNDAEKQAFLAECKKQDPRRAAGGGMRK